ncbi:MAG: hypothetical protein AAGI48_04810 [Verrucomicrobiota bacterium]
MRKLTIFTTILLGFFFSIPEADARSFGRGKGGGGGGRAKPSYNKGRSVKRSPATNSRISRPKPKSKPKQTYRPQSRPTQRPSTKPTQRPTTRPTQRPSTKPTQRPTTRPSTRPTTRPSTRPSTGTPSTRPNVSRPDKRPSVSRPGNNKPSTLPGMVTYPNRPDKGKLPNRPGNGSRPGVGDGNRPGSRLPGTGDGNRPNLGDRKPSIVDRDFNNRGKINVGDRNRTHIDKVNVGRRNVGLNRPSTLPANRRNWDGNKWGGNNSVWGNRVNIGNDININVDNRFRRNNNFACRPGYWGGRPWWGCGNYHRWHHGHWGYGWNRRYYHHHWYYNDNDFAEGFMWGIAVWSLGNMIYDMGYKSYQNPYPAQPVQNTYVNYSEPVSVAAAANPPGDEATAAANDEKSETALEASRTAFKSGDYVTALAKCDEALGYTPSDGTMHEYRALIQFALGKYGDAAGTLNPVLASGPGWSWDTMISFYNGSEAYNDQLDKLEDYAKKTDSADGHFLLGYHYLVCGHLEQANAEFARAAEQQPADTISAQLRDLTASSIPTDSGEEVETTTQPDPVPVDKLVGSWVCDTGTGKVTFTMNEGGDYTWKFDPSEGQASELKGTYGLDDKGLLVLSSDDSQMVSIVEMKEEGKMHFALIGAPERDPGLDFSKT